MGRWVDTSRIACSHTHARTHVHPRLGAQIRPGAAAGAIGGALHGPSNDRVGGGAESARVGSSRGGGGYGESVEVALRAPPADPTEAARRVRGLEERIEAYNERMDKTNDLGKHMQLSKEREGLLAELQTIRDAQIDGLRAAAPPVRSAARPPPCAFSTIWV